MNRCFICNATQLCSHREPELVDWYSAAVSRLGMVQLSAAQHKKKPEGAEFRWDGFRWKLMLERKTA